MKKGRAAARRVKAEEKRAEAMDDMATRMAALERKLDQVMTAMGIVDGDAEEDEAEAENYNSMTVDELEAEIDERGIADAVVGTGKNDSVVKADLITALEADDSGGLA